MELQSKRPSAVFFDVDDTLYDHLIPFRKAVDGWIADKASFPYEQAYHRMRYYSDKLSMELGGAGAMAADRSAASMRSRRFRLTLADFGIAVTDVEAERIQQAYAGCQFDIDMFEGARELLHRLADSGCLVGLITNGEGPHQMKKINAMRLESVIPAELIFVSGNVGWDKPNRRLFRHINETTGTLPGECVYIGDSWRNDVIGALEAGWTAIWFNHRNALPESGHEPHHRASSIRELERLLFEEYGLQHKE